MKCQTLLLSVALAALLLCAVARAEEEDYTRRDDYVHRSVLGSPSKQKALWAAWKAKYAVKYRSTEEESFRFSLFQNTLRRVVRNNDRLAARGKGPNFGLNKFADMDQVEWSALYLNKNLHKSAAKRAALSKIPAFKPAQSLRPAIPYQLDWRQYNVVSYVQDQGACGSCWAFSTAESTESGIQMKYNYSSITSLSPQQIVDCDTGDGNLGCTGGDPALAYVYVEKYGLMDLNDYPYSSGATGEAGVCTYNKAQVKGRIKGFNWATAPCCPPSNTTCNDSPCAHQNDVDLVYSIAAHGPAGILVDASEWQDYTFGIFSFCGSTYDTMDHAVQVVGWQQQAAHNPPGVVDAWLVRNSWGQGWGIQGYILLEGNSQNNNTCGISNEAIWVTAL